MKKLGACGVSLVLIGCGAEYVDAPQPPVDELAAAEPEVALVVTPMDSLHGHLAYEETDAPLADAGRYRDTGRVVQLRAEAAASFRAMQRAAREAGVNITPISGFRTKRYQDGLFSRAIGKYGSTESAARWVAPPGYSEHHSGLALDIGDADRPETDVETAFEDTPAFRWLAKNARRFEFELSFPKGNPQGVSYEPWHWRYTGLPDAPWAAP
ncbi:MAG: D-alanyl-D-alanine carboxypeptidase family protein [Gammaproteobacteria bacterium]|nr:D-alanyl-D-alanine carboxypeptidase family protein [Gammaproteobacteria bacterium]